jgi:hypothetical protein
MSSDRLQDAINAVLEHRQYGSMEFVATSKPHTTPSLRLLFRLVLSERRTGDNGCSGWPTASSRYGKGGYTGGRIRDGKISTDTLDVVAQLASWPTPDTNTCGGAQDAMKRKAGGHSTRVQDVAQLAAWPTPNAMEGGQTSRGGKRKDERLMGGLVGWATPRATDAKTGHDYTENMTGKSLAMDASLTAGQGSTSCPAETGKRGVPRIGVLNPFFSLQLMGFPVSWGLAGICAWLKSKKR